MMQCLQRCGSIRLRLERRRVCVPVVRIAAVSAERRHIRLRDYNRQKNILAKGGTVLYSGKM